MMEKVVLFSECTSDAFLFYFVFKKLHQSNVCRYCPHTDYWIEIFTASIFSGVLAVCARSVDFRFNADLEALKQLTNNKILLWAGTGVMSTNPKMHTECNLRCIDWLVLDKRFPNESVMMACPIHTGNLKQN